MTSKCPPLFIKHQTIEEVDSHKVLGVTVDNNLSWCKYVTALCKTASKKVYQLSRIKHFLYPHASKLFFQFHAHIQSIIDYGCYPLGLGQRKHPQSVKPLVSLHLEESA